MNMELISKASLIVFDALCSDEGAKDIIQKIDEGENDADLKAGLREAITYLKAHNKRHIAEDVETKLKGFI